MTKTAQRFAVAAKRLTIAGVQGAAYFRVSAKGSGANLIVTLDEEIT